jgi:hypothetical protein
MVASGTEARAGSVAALVVNERAKIAACKAEAEAGPTALSSERGRVANAVWS